EVGPDYFATLGIPLVGGREITRADDERAPRVAVVNEAMAEKYWGSQDPVGQRVQVKGRWMQVVGVAKQARYGNFLPTPKPFRYVPMRQSYSLRTVLYIRTSQAPGTIATALAREIHALDGSLAPQEVITLYEHIDRSTAPQRIAVTLLTLFGGLALLLAAVG